MPSWSVSLSLLVLLGCVLASALPVQSVTDTLKEVHESIASALGLTQLEVNRDPRIDLVIRTINTSCQRKDDIQLMNATLDIYMRVFSKVLHHNHHGNSQSAGLLNSLKEPERDGVIKALKKLQEKMEELKKRLICQNQYREDALNQLEKIQVDDPMEQKKVLAQFLKIYQAASTIAASAE